MYHKKHRTKTKARTRARTRVRTRTRSKRFKKTQKGGGNKEAIIAEINAGLQQHCKNAFKIIITKNKNDDGYDYIELLKDGVVVSDIMLEINQDKNEIYMHSNTKDEFQNKKYNTFLRSVVILYSYYMGFSIIGTNPSNWISYYTVYHYFDFYTDPTEFGSGDYNDWVPFTQGKPKLEIKESKKLLQKLTKEDDYPPFVLALNEIDLDKYKTLCIDILTKLDC